MKRWELFNIAVSLFLLPGLTHASFIHESDCLFAPASASHGMTYQMAVCDVSLSVQTITDSTWPGYELIRSRSDTPDFGNRMLSEGLFTANQRLSFQMFLMPLTAPQSQVLKLDTAADTTALFSSSSLNNRVPEPATTVLLGLCCATLFIERPK
jgi:hypothetical protein